MGPGVEALISSTYGAGAFKLRLMSLLLEALRRQTNRLRFYSLLSFLISVFLIFVLNFCFALSVSTLLRAFKFLSLTATSVFYFLAAGGSILGIFLQRKYFLEIFKIGSVDAATEIERQSSFFKENPEWKSELVSAASFLGKKSLSDFEQAHLKRVASRFAWMKVEVFPKASLGWGFLLSAIGTLFLSQTPSVTQVFLPERIRAWTPSSFQILLPYPEARWMEQSGVLSGVAGSQVRFESPNFGAFQSYLFVQGLNGKWVAHPCQKFCELVLREPGQYSVGTLASRSTMFPLQVVNDEIPKSAIFAELQGELIPALSLEILNQQSLKLELTASDDLRLKRVELLHRFQDVETILASYETSEKFFKKTYVLSFEGWKGGEHEIFLRPFDDFRSSDSSPLKILFNDENSLREKRIQDLNALVNEWTHVLADLIETKMDGNLSENLGKRLLEIHYPLAEDQSLAAAYVNELQKLSERIQNWISMGAPLRNIDNLIARTEKQILYGLSLIFQEKAGDIQSTSNDLAQTQSDLAMMMEKIKEGKLDFKSGALDEAFKKLSEKLAELQTKISSLPQGPNDSMINREALEAQAAESESLQQKIDQIRKQAEAGDEKGAMRELDSLLNQLSILTKEMERGLDQWKKNLDQGSIQKAQEFGKKLEELKKQEMDLNAKTEALKSKMDKLEENNSAVFSPKEAKELKKLQEENKVLEQQQKGISEKLSEARKEFDTAMEGSEWKQLLRSQEVQEREDQIGERMIDSENGLKEQQLLDASTQQKEAVELLNKAIEQQQQMMKQIQKMSQPETAGGRHPEKIEIRGSEAKGERERRKRIMESLKQQVGDKFQQSHERYFEEMLQR